MWSIALKTLFADRGKLLTALVGVVFSMVLVNVQGGLFVGLLRKASLLVDNVQADIWVGHKDMHNVDFTQDIPRHWVDRIRSVPGVGVAEPYLIGWGNITKPNGGFEPVVVIGCDRASMLGNAWNVVSGGKRPLDRNDGVIMDEEEFAKLANPQLGDVREIGGSRARLVGVSKGIVGFLVAPYVFTTLDRATAYVRSSPDVCSYFLVKLAPGADAAEVAERIRRRVPHLEVMPSDEYGQLSVDFWMTRTGLGISFGAATLLGLLVGLVMVAQTLYASVLDRLGEFGALKAMGAEERDIYRMLFAQAITMAAGGAIIGLFVVAAVQRLFSTARAPIVIPFWLSLGSCCLVLAICLLSSLLPYLRIRKVDPAMVLQA